MASRYTGHTQSDESISEPLSPADSSSCNHLIDFSNDNHWYLLILQHLPTYHISQNLARGSIYGNRHTSKIQEKKKSLIQYLQVMTNRSSLNYRPIKCILFH